jgi:hypothetical protein
MIDIELSRENINRIINSLEMYQLQCGASENYREQREIFILMAYLDLKCNSPNTSEICLQMADKIKDEHL